MSKPLEEVTGSIFLILDDLSFFSQEDCAECEQ